jgi:hypothetical protein
MCRCLCAFFFCGRHILYPVFDKLHILSVRDPVLVLWCWPNNNPKMKKRIKWFCIVTRVGHLVEMT